ncbi:MAG: protein phosphatase 2C domain-containing protein [Alphaproteobacteria bacterium]|nr:protein phosphatase 2C domain-containing protein [Alphaproteobacteria bacterium]
MKVSFASFSRAGPRPINEDALDCWIAASGETVACIADGLGGMGGGDKASQLAVSSFRKYLEQSGIDSGKMLEAAKIAHRSIREAQMSNEVSNRMATTLTAVALFNDRIVGVHCGDSRAAIARRQGIKRLTKDHTEGQRLFEAGKLSKDELAKYQRKHILESALGDQNEPSIDSISFDILPGDHIILTTDGVHNHVLLREMQRLSASASSPVDLIDHVELALKKAGPSDNYSMIALFVE